MTRKSTRIMIFFTIASLDHALYRSRRGSEIDARQIVVVERRDAIVARPRQPRLRVRHLDAVCHARSVAPLGLRQFVFRQPQTLFGGPYLRIGGSQPVQRQPDVELDLIAEIHRSDFLLTILRHALGPPRIAPSPIEQRDAERDTYRSSGQQVRRTGSQVAVIGKGCNRWKPLHLRRAVVEPRVVFAPFLSL